MIRSMPRQPENIFPIGVGYYSIVEAARLLKFPERKLRRWLRGYSFLGRDGVRHAMRPLWQLELPESDRLELSFLDLVNLRYVGALLEAGVTLQTVRICIDRAIEITGSSTAFGSLGFKTDGRAIFMAVERELDAEGAESLLDLKLLQYVMTKVVEPSFRDFEYDDRRVIRWRPSQSQRDVVLDPAIAFGQPIIQGASVPTKVIDDAIIAEKSERRVAQLYDLSVAQVRQAVKFERELKAA